MLAELLSIATLFIQMTAGANDLMVVERSSSHQAPPQDVRYLRSGQRQRVEHREFLGGGSPDRFFGPRSAVIYQCDRKRVIYLNLDTKRFLIEEIFVPRPGSLPAVVPAPSNSKPSTHHSSVTRLEETEERKLFHGRQAWLVRASNESNSTFGGKVYHNTSTTETWYIELDAPKGCFAGGAGRLTASFLSAEGTDYEHKVIGSARRGFPIATKHIFKTPQGETRVFRTEVVEFSEQPLDPALFEVPADFTETRDWEEISPPLRLRWWEKVMVWLYRITH